MSLRLRLVVIFGMILGVSGFQMGAQSWEPAQLPLTQGAEGTEGSTGRITEWEASRDDRWLGLGVRDVRWHPDGKSLYFRWSSEPQPGDDPETDPWFEYDVRSGRLRVVEDGLRHSVPGPEMVRSHTGGRAAWVDAGRLYLFSPGEGVRLLYSGEKPAESPRFGRNGESLFFQSGSDLFSVNFEDGTFRRRTAVVLPDEPRGEAEEWLRQQQVDLLSVIREREDREEARKALLRGWDPSPAQPIPVEKGSRIQDIQLSPDERFVTFRWQKEDSKRRRTQILHYASRSGYAETEEARSKVGDPQDRYRMGIVRVDPSKDPKQVEVVWVKPPGAEEPDENLIVYGPYWSLEGDQAVVQLVSLNHQDRWICSLNLEDGTTRVIHHDHDSAWLGGPPPVAGYLQPALLEWLPGGAFVFASEQTGWSHLYLYDGETTRPLTSGEWEVREAQLSADRKFWLIGASREHACDDHLYTLPARGGELVKLTNAEGRNQGFLSSDGTSLAVVWSDSVHLPDLFLREIGSGSRNLQITRSGTENYYRYPLVRPVTVSFPHPDGRPVWAALFRPRVQNPERAAVIHVHGGGYRQFSHHGWSVYGFSGHLGLIHALLERGYTVLDFDYRGGAGFGRDYRTDIYKSMGDKDVAGAVAAVDFLAEKENIDRGRVGIYGLSYGGFFTLMSLFKYPGVFAAGVANASVTDWAHYNHVWTSRVLGLPWEDPDAYQISSPIYHAEGLRDPLLIVHGLVDENVQFQDAARLVQKLIELEKDFELTVYPVERHVIATEPSRFDYVKRVTGFFERHLLRRAGR